MVAGGVDVERRAVFVGEGLEVDVLAVESAGVFVMERVHVELGVWVGEEA